MAGTGSAAPCGTRSLALLILFLAFNVLFLPSVSGISSPSPSSSPARSPDVLRAQPPEPCIVPEELSPAPSSKCPAEYARRFAACGVLRESDDCGPFCGRTVLAHAVLAQPCETAPDFVDLCFLGNACRRRWCASLRSHAGGPRRKVVLQRNIADGTARAELLGLHLDRDVMLKRL